MSKYDIQAQAVTLRNQTINKLVPAIQARLAEGFKQKADGSLYKKDAEAIRDIINAHKLDRFRFYLRPSGYSLWAECDINYPTGDHGCAYKKKDIFLWNCDTGESGGFEPLPEITGNDIEQAKQKAEVLREHKRAIDNQLLQLSKVGE